ncbi:DNA excision repair protein ERCC-6-like isoform X1 [Argiope bruennichi]|uniref:DNA excision repair protein ERCC-6-like isoform X1 n=1 Tax=Argiope bruennichi TaxID=94029 RepID=UPI0024955B26|nr:DNA excision repair protein ERCC-6-like isoform X1 [Argiope bruennichi]
MEFIQDLENETDNDVLISVPLSDELKLCSDIMLVKHNLSNETHSKDLNSGDSCALNQTSDDAVPCSSKSERFCISKESISCVPEADQEKELLDLGVSVYDQIQFETEVIAQVDKALKDQEERKRLEDTRKELHTVEEDLRFVKNRLNQIEKALSMAPKAEMTNAGKRELSAILKEKENKLKHKKKLEAKLKALQVCICGSVEEVNTVLQNNVEGSEEQLDEETVYHLKQVFIAKETEEEKMIRTGEMTPFGTVITNQAKDKRKPRKITIPTDSMTDFDKFLLNQAENHMSKTSSKNYRRSKPSLSKSANKDAIKSQQSLEFQGFTDLKAISSKKNKTLSKAKLGSKFATGFSKTSNRNESLIKNFRSDSELSDTEVPDDDEWEIKDNANNYSSDDVYIPDKNDLDDDYDEKIGKVSKKRKARLYSKKTKKNSADSLSDSEDEDKTLKKKLKKLVDDGNQESYIKRIKALEKSEWVQKQLKMVENDGEDSAEEDVTEFDEGYKIPNRIWNKLYKYQKTAVRWLWELHQQNCGGIIGDEMGLGKTIQIIAFLIGLKFSALTSFGENFKGLGPVILVCPATVMHQWLKEFYTWWPYFRVAILHESGSFMGKKESLIRIITKNHGILITTYTGVVQHQENLLKHEWHYVILDEGHKIRNPDAQATLAVKQFRTPHRIILSGSPIQNNLKELWSLFDFIFPGKLGTLPVFMQQFSVPIVLGGYANASQIQVQTAYKCATVLRDAIKPYLLRRMKSDVKMSINLPDKNEQVLFCKLTEHQENLYKAYISSKEVSSILNARLQVFVGLVNLRKICNHPDIFDGGPKIFKDTDISQLSEEEHYGYYKRSGKMIVVEALLRLWHKQGHRVLLFTQSRQMLQIFEIFVKSKNYTYMKMDGSTSISSRQPAVEKFNSDSNIFVFLLTTRVGGLGVNLTGANRVILYDPDWNPSTDVQARERAWRIGQNKQVTIYRLMTAGTIEEKIYHRQIFKQFVTNRVLKDPKQRRFFKSNDLYELFTYSEVGPQGTETSCIFAGTGSEIKLKKKFKRPDKSLKKESNSQPVNHSDVAVSFTEEKKEQMRMLAKKLSLELAKTSLNSKSEDSKPTVQKALKNDSDQPVLEISIENKDGRELSKIEVPGTTLSKLQKRKASKIEGEKIDYVVKKSIYKPPENEEGDGLNEDDYVLSKLFKKSGVHTALKHDVIVESSTPDYSIVEGEANRVATEAIKALKESRRMCAQASEGIPTWTGQHGGFKPRFGQKKKLPVKIPTSSVSSCKTSSKNTKKGFKFDGKKDNTSSEAVSSSDLLSAIRSRKIAFSTNSDNDGENSFGAIPSIPRLTTDHDKLLADLRNYIAFESAICGQATTKELIEAFKEKVPITQTAIFKALLNKLCDFSRTSGEGTWYLKSEFR